MEQLTIVIIDDDPVSHLIARKVIQNSDPNCVITRFFNPIAALEYFTQHHDNIDHLPDIIFLDLNMPVMDGWQFLEALGAVELKKDIYLVMLTSSVYREDKIKASQFELVNAFESKPLTTEKYRAIKEKALDYHVGRSRNF
jgi:CheY-like chemotaxis protein